MTIPRILTTLISTNIPVLKRTTYKSIQLSGWIPHPMERLVRKKSLTTPSGNIPPINCPNIELVIIPIKRSNLGSFSKVQGINEIDIKVEIDKDSCMGVGSCVSIAPQVFKIDESSLKSSFMAYAPLKLLDEHGASNQTILEAAQSCPYKAIIVNNKDNDEKIFP